MQINLILVDSNNFYCRYPENQNTNNKDSYLRAMKI